jgi:hypothetical protein
MKKIVSKQSRKSKPKVQGHARKYNERVIIKEPFHEAITRLIRVKSKKKP